MAALLYPAASFCVPSSVNTLQQTKAQLADRAKQEKQLSAELATNSKTLQTLRLRATNLAQDLQRSESALSSSEDKTGRITHDIRIREAALANEQNELRSAMVSMINLERMPMLAFLAQKDSAQTTLRTAAALSMVRETLSERAEHIKRDIAALHKAREDLYKAQSLSKRQRITLLKQRSALMKDVDARSKLQAKLSLQHSEARKEMAALAARASSLSDLIEKIDKEKPQTPVRTDIRNFGRPGSLVQPVSGKILHRFGEPKGLNDTYRGIVIQPRSGAVVVAPYDGQIVFAGVFRDYGHMVLLRHKNGYISMLAGLNRSQVSLQQSVRIGEPIGIMGATAKENLYVELRENSKPVDPLAWLAKLR